jgi:hypothetical protein
MAGTMAIRWTSAARLAGIVMGAVAALALLASALEPPAPAAVPDDVGIDVAPADPPIARPGDPERELERREPGRKAHDRPRRPPRPHRREDDDRSAKKAPPAPRPSPPAPAPSPPASIPPAPPPAPAPAPTPGPIAPPEFGFER